MGIEMVVMKKCPKCGNEDFDKVEVDIGQAYQIVDHCKKCNSCFFQGEYKGQLCFYLNWEIVS